MKVKALFVGLTALAMVALGKAPEPITNRKNVAAALYGATAVVTNADGTTQEAPSLLEGSHSDNAAVSLSGVPSSVEIIFAQPAEGQSHSPGARTCPAVA